MGFGTIVRFGTQGEADVEHGEGRGYGDAGCAEDDRVLTREEPSRAAATSTAVEEEEDDKKPITVNPKHKSLTRPVMRPLTLGNWTFDVVADLTKVAVSSVPTPATNINRDARRISFFIPIAPEAFTDVHNKIRLMHGRRPSSIQVLPHPPTLRITVPQSAHTTVSRRRILQFTPTSPTVSSF